MADARKENHGSTGGGDSAWLVGGGELGALIRSKDWSTTPLGPIESWPQSLRTAVQIVLTSRQPFWIGWGSDLIYLYNDPYKSIIGRKHPQMLGQPASVVWREIWEVIGPMLSAAMAGTEGTYVESQLLIMERHGFREETYYTFSYSPIPDVDGKPGGIICANTDDTGRVVGERQLKLLRDLAASTADARSWKESCQRGGKALASNLRDLPFAMIYIAEPDGQSLSLAAASGIEPGHPAAPQIITAVTQSPWPLAAAVVQQDVIVVDDLHSLGLSPLPTGLWQEPPHQAALVPIAAAGQTGRGGVLVVGLNPFRLFDEGYRNFLLLAAGQISASIVSAQAHEGERKRAEALLELDHAKTTFFSNISHEFRTPLTLMLGPVEQMLRNDGRMEREQLELLHRNSLRLLKLVNTMLDFSRIEAGRMKGRFAPIDLAGCTIELAAAFRRAVERAGLQLIVHCSPLTGPPAYVDPEMWEKIVLNLLSNAFKYTLKGEIEVSLKTHGDHVALVVRDTGVGIPTRELPYIFDRFHRVDDARGRTHEGSGIGLALVRELVALHGGTVHVESVLNEGSRFSVRIPLGCAHLDPTHIALAPPPRSAGAGVETIVEEALRWLPQTSSAVEPRVVPEVAPTNSLITPRARILLADDNDDMRRYVSQLLGDRYEVEAVADGQAALDAAMVRRPDVVISDIMMPRLDGFGLLRSLRSDAQLREVPIIFLSARAGEEARLEGIEFGADDYLIKPFSARELLARVDAQIRMSRIRAEMSQTMRESRHRLAAVLEQLPLSVAVIDTDYGVTLANEQWRQYASHPVHCKDPEQIKRWRAVRADGTAIPPDQWPLPRSLQGETVPGMDFQHTLEDGRIIWVRVSSTPFRDDTGRIIGAISSLEDITERKQAAADLEFQKYALDQSSIVAITDVAGTITYVNDKFCEISGYSRAELIGRNHRLINSGLHSREFFLNMYRTICRGDVWHGEIRNRRKNGSFYWVQTTIVPSMGADGRPQRYVAIRSDITERKQAEEALQRSRDELEERVAARTIELQHRAEQLSRLTSELTLTERRERQRLAKVLHDHLQQLLVSAQLGLELASRNAGERARQPLERVKSCLEQAISASRSLTVELAPPILQDAGLAAGLEWLARWMQTQHEIEVDLSLEPAADPRREDVRTLVFESVRELLFNVVKHAGVKKAAIELAVHDETNLRVVVSDQGRGFDPGASAQHPRGHRGFGLFSIRERLMLLGGRFSIESADGGGTRITLIAPRLDDPSLLSADGDDTELTEAAATDRKEPDAPKQQRIRLLIADDHAVMREGLCILLGEEPDFDIVGEAGDGVEALERAHSLQPDIVLIDYSMPRMDGVEATRRIRTELPHIQVIGLSMYGEPDRAKAMLDAGAAVYLTKSGQSAQIIQSIHALGIKARNRSN